MGLAGLAADCNGRTWGSSGPVDPTVAESRHFAAAKRNKSIISTILLVEHAPRHRSHCNQRYSKVLHPLHDPQSPRDC